MLRHRIFFFFLNRTLTTTLQVMTPQSVATVHEGPAYLISHLATYTYKMYIQVTELVLRIILYSLCHYQCDFRFYRGRIANYSFEAKWINLYEYSYYYYSVHLVVLLTVLCINGRTTGVMAM